MQLSHTLNLNSAYQHLAMHRNSGKAEDAPFSYYIKVRNLVVAWLLLIWAELGTRDLLQLLTSFGIPRPN